MHKIISPFFARPTRYTQTLAHSKEEIISHMFLLIELQKKAPLFGGAFLISKWGHHSPPSLRMLQLTVTQRYPIDVWLRLRRQEQGNHLLLLPRVP